MDHRNEVREFLTSRRARITPQQAGLPAYGGNRRVAGLRREEVAMLAGMSIDYYTRLERGNLGGASEGVLESLALALQLDEAERAHLFDLARTANMGSLSVAKARRKSTPLKVRPSLQRVLDSITGAPAWVRNDRLDFLAANRLGAALYSPILSSAAQPANSARFCFLDPSAHDYYDDWETTANDIVAVLRTEAGRHPFDSSLTELVGELSTRSEDFRVRWANHNVRFHRTGRKKLHHPVVGDLEFTYEALLLPADPGLTLFVYTAEPNSPTQESLDFLASWADGPAQESVLATRSDRAAT